ncbi:GGDEF domain-containing protein [Paucibacter sp. XJ19-41]|uniref:GGDEF domain-containing protein n=1 Tax=Paucibacter sp. XJ19-41 TaxID=2927824 RepID=UPI0023490250|nr:GGDEF domain-containing protein [Paucibacter sp. XJ19-41]MDC6168134.1 GGDEF domain-containing protein [Paucibacter sp. XJ19-41]
MDASSQALALDARTMLAAISMVGFMMAVMAFSTARAIPEQPMGLREWGVSMAATGGACLLFFLRGHAPWLLTFLFANVLIMAVTVFGVLALARLTEQRVTRHHLVLLSSFGIGGTLLTYLELAPWAVTVFTMSCALALMLARMAWLVLRYARRTGLPVAYLTAAVAAVMATAFAMRALFSAGGASTQVAPAASSTPQLFALAMATLFVVAASIGFFSMAHERQRRELQELSRRDGLTGLYNRRAFFELAAAIEQARPAEAFAVLMVDLDHFKQINDRYGHGGGDLVLAHAARMMAGAVRLSDIAGRYGGEEFCLLLRGCATSVEAAQRAEALVQAASASTVRVGEQGRVVFTLSIGYACRRRDTAALPESLKSVLERADHALYAAKNSGRNRALSAEISTPGSPAHPLVA